MRVFTASLATETNTFAPLPTGLAAFKDRGYFPAGQHPDRMTLFGAPLWAARQRASELGWTLLEGLVAFANPSGTITRETYETLRDQLLADLVAALPVDIVLLGLHGAMVAEGYDDCEGDLLGRVRQLAGADVVIGAELDPHSHLSDAMVKHADVLVMFKEYPHTDILERAQEVVELCRRQALGEINPVAAVVDCEMVVPIHTTREPGRSFVDRIQALEGKDGILSISVAQGFATGDVADMGCKVLVYADADAAAAQRLARRLADELIAMRDELLVRYLDIDTALDRALAASDGPVVLADRSDNPGSGAAGDSTFILRTMLERRIDNAALGPLWDPMAVQIAFDAGLGATLAMRIGGKVGPMSGDPVDGACKVVALIRDMTMTGQAGTPAALGDCALIEIGGIQVVLCSRRTQALNIDLFTQLSCNLSDKKIVVVKSAQHFHASFSTIAREILYVGAPGSASPDWDLLPYTKIRFPKWPINQKAQ